MLNVKCALVLCVAWAVAAVAGDAPNREPRRLTLRECLETALLNNRDLQIEQLNPAVAAGLLSASYGYYDPIFLGDVRKENDADRGGFDPANFSADAVYEAESTIANGSLIGFLPSGMTYTLYGNYANATGTRNSLDFDSYKLFLGFTVRQPLLRNMWIDLGRLTIKLNKENLRFSEFGVRYIAMTVINRVQQAYYDLVYAHEAQLIQQELVDAREQMLRGMRRQFEQGLAAEPDVQLAQAQLAAAQTLLNASGTDVALAENELRTAMGDSFTNQVTTRWAPADHALLLPAELDLGESWKQGVLLRPDLAQFRVNVEKARIDLRFRRNQLFPSLDITAGYGRRGAATEEDVPPFTPQASLGDAFEQFKRGEAPRDMVGVILTMPLTMQAERGNFRMSKALKEQSEILLKQKEELVLREISDALHTARTNYERSLAARDAMHYSRSALQAEERRLQGGTSTIFFVLQLQNSLVTAQLAEARARADYNKALADLYFAEGTLLERQQIDFEFE